MGKKFRNIIILMACILLCCIVSHKDANAQGNARSLYKKGLKAPDINLKIKYLKSAIEQDRTFTMAYYELGRVYETTGAFDQAILNLKRTLMANPSDLSEEFRFQIVYKIGLIQKKNGRLDEAIGSLSGAINLTSEPKIQSEVYTELGAAYAELGNIDKAVDSYKNVRRLVPEKATEMEKRMRQLSNKKQLYNNYNEGLKHLQNKRYQEAIAAFKKVTAADSSFKDTHIKLAETQAKFNAIQKTASWEIIYKKGLEYLAEQNWSQAEDLFQQLIKKNPDYKDGRLLLDRARRGQSDTIVAQNALSTHKKDVNHFNDKSRTSSINTVEKTPEAKPGSSEALLKLQQVKNQSENEQNDTVKQLYYSQAVEAFQINDWVNAIALFEHLARMDPNYKDIQYLLAEARKAQQEPVENSEAAKLYQRGIECFEQAAWLNAVIAFEKVVMLEPDYKEVQAYLTKAKTSLKNKEIGNIETKTVPPESKGLGLLAPTIAFACVIILVLGYIFIPSIRGNLYLMQGKKEKAGLVFKRQFEKKPLDPNISLKLATIYCELKREDEYAIKVYETVLRLNLDTSIKKDISAIVAYYYLSNGNADKNKIDILERALRNAD